MWRVLLYWAVGAVIGVSIGWLLAYWLGAEDSWIPVSTMGSLGALAGAQIGWRPMLKRARGEQRFWTAGPGSRE